jgi:hypothetical protein
MLTSFGAISLFAEQKGCCLQNFQSHDGRKFSRAMNQLSSLTQEGVAKRRWA